jgi:chromate transporter
MAPVLPAQPLSHRLRELAFLFLKLGTIGFGGPAAHLALMEDEVVRRRRWLTHAEFLDLVGAANLIPGPNSTELAIHLGRLRAGTPGLLVAGASFILPATAIVTACAWAYVRFGSLPAGQHLLWGVKPVVLAIVVHALVRLARTAVKSRALALAGIAATAASALGVHELAVLFLTGLAVLLAREARPGPRASPPPPSLLLVPGALGASAGAVAASPYALGTLFLFFLKVGSVLYGSGYVLLAFLRADLVQRWGWLTESQLLDAIAVGQVTPGPLFTTATFIGYVLGGPAAALLATLGIFLPAFLFVAASAPWVPRLRASPVAGAFLDGVNVASLALMTVVTWQLGKAAVADLPAAALALGASALLFATRLDATWLVLAGAAIGLLAG